MAKLKEHDKYPGLSDSQFAGYNHTYPDNTEKRAHAALSYGARYASPGEYEHIKREVHHDWPSIKIKGMNDKD